MRERVLERGIFQEISAAESFIDADVDMLVDGRGDDESAEAAVVGRQVGAAAADGDSQEVYA